MRQIILHAGLPKAATTTIQAWAATHRGDLAAEGISYPASLSPSAEDPRHRLLLRGLLNGELSIFEAALARDTTARIFLSDEGLSLRLSHFPEACLQKFRQVIQAHRLKLLLTTRPCTSFRASRGRAL